MAQSFHPNDVAVLVVEDDAFIRAEMADVAEEAGFTSYSAADAVEAIRLLERHPHIRVLFTDIDMQSDPDGMTLANVVVGRWPPVRVIVTSGRCGVAEAEMPVGSCFLPKPYDTSEVLGVMARLRAQIDLRR